MLQYVAGIIYLISVYIVHSSDFETQIILRFQISQGSVATKHTVIKVRWKLLHHF